MIKLYSNLETISIFPREGFQEYEFYHHNLSAKENSLIYIFAVFAVFDVCGKDNMSFLVWLEDPKDEISLFEQLADFNIDRNRKDKTFLKLLSLNEQEYFKTGNKIDDIEDTNLSLTAEELCSLDEEQLLDVYLYSKMNYPTEKSIIVFNFVKIYDVYSFLKFLSLNISIEYIDKFLPILNEIEDYAVNFQDYDPYKLYNSCCLNKDYFEFLRKYQIFVFYDSFIIKAINYKKYELIQYLSQFFNKYCIFTPFFQKINIQFDENNMTILEKKENDEKEIIFDTPMHSFYVMKVRNEKTLYYGVEKFDLNECLKFMNGENFEVCNLPNGYMIRSEKTSIVLYNVCFHIRDLYKEEI